MTEPTKRKRCTKPQPLEAVNLPGALVTLRTGGAYLGLSASAMHRLIRAGRLEVIRMGKRCTRVTAESVRAFAAAR